MIYSFADRGTEDLYHRNNTTKTRKLLPNSLISIAIRKLDMLDSAIHLNDLRAPPGNHLEALTGNWRGYHSIRINNQYRIVFKWTELGPEQVSIVDYH